MKRVGLARTASLLCVLLGVTAFGNAQQERQEDKEDRRNKQAEPERQKGQHQQDQNRQEQQRTQQQGRLPQQRQQQLVQEQQERMTQYRQRLDQKQFDAHSQRAQLQQQGRMAQYRFQGDYLELLRQQQLRVQNDRNHNYDRDAYYYTASNYRYQRGGRYYETNEYGANVLRQAVDNGYGEGFGTGQADRQDRWRSDYQNSYAYEDANYGYNGYYVPQDDYNYYFREGFRRGYEDGYNSRYQYGSYSSGRYSVLGAVLSEILGFQSIR